ncbi:proton channel OTOP1-like [Bufo gargarizans]|uniref:proton channel OTOP1-like n=1 Tax=Bufo gargarizans TaxID=30331 RepID=UPI001CF42308|nr:proton channel OTOP1-like [Bufo gargarizans]
MAASGGRAAVLQAPVSASAGEMAASSGRAAELQALGSQAARVGTGSAEDWRLSRGGISAGQDLRHHVPASGITASTQPGFEGLEEAGTGWGSAQAGFLRVVRGDVGAVGKAKTGNFPPKSKKKKKKISISDMTDNSGHATVNGIPVEIMDVVDEIIFPPPPTMADPHIGANKILFSKRHKNSEIASSQYGINLFIVGLLLMFATYLNITGLTESERLIFLIVLMLIQVLWMIFYMAVGNRKKWATDEKDGHAGARWLKCGIGLFAGTTIVMHALKIGYFVGYAECKSIIEGVYPVIHIIHTLFQVYFLWRHSKDIIKSFKTLERFGLIHSVYTNLLLWASAVATESDHQLEEHMGRLTSLGFLNITLHGNHLDCNCTNSLCDSFQKGIYYIYPFYIEYQILASAMLYVLWKNIGNKLGHSHHRSKLTFGGVVPGTLLGLSVLAATIATVAIYLLNIGRSKNKSESALSVFYFYSIIVLGFMCIISMIGLVLYKLDKNLTMKEKSPAVKLDEDLLVGSAIGSWIMSWGSIIATIFAESHPTFTWYNLPYCILVILEKYFQNLFIISHINRKDKHHTKMPPMEISVTSGEISFPIESTDFRTDKGDKMKIHNLEHHNAMQLHAMSPNDIPRNSYARLKKTVLKNITIVLFLCNISSLHKVANHVIQAK